MKRLTLIILFLIASVIVTAGVLWTSRSVKAVTVQINVKDFPEHGITIIGPSHQDFDSLMISYLRRRPHLSASALKPFSIFITNNSDRIIVAYRLRWELTTAEGATITKTSAQASTWMLRDSAASKNKTLVDNEKSLIRPKTTLFFSLAANPEPLEDSDSSNAGLNIFLLPQKNVSPQQPQDSDQEALLKRLNDELRQYTSVTISIDGMFFDDGAFIGLDSTGYFNDIDAQINAERDVQRMIAGGKRLGKTDEQVFTDLGDLMRGPEVSIDINSTPADYYYYYKRMFVKSYLRNITPISRKRVIERLVHQSKTEPVKLHKL